MVHHPGSLSNQPLLQQIVEVTLEDLYWRPEEIDSTRMEFTDEDNGGLQGQWLVLFPQQIISTRLRVFEIVGVYGPPNTLSRSHQWSADIQVRSERIVRLGNRGATHGLTVHGPRGVVHNVSKYFRYTTSNIFSTQLQIFSCDNIPAVDIM